jgi:4-amino-4-deoxy-L-arabinose transferase-like glycosyltransferase
MASYSIALFTHLFHTSVFWIRFPVFLYSTLDAVVLFLIAQTFLKDIRPALWTLVIFNLAPLFLIGSVVITPDVPLIFFWTLTLYFFIKALDSDSIQYWLFAGFALGFSLLSKYTGILLLPSAFLFLLLSKQDRKWLRKPHPYLTVFPALLVFSPVIYWNIKHHFVSFLFQSSTRASEVSGKIRPDAFLQFLTGQMAVITPIIFICFVFALFYTLKSGLVIKDRRYALLFSFSIIPFVVCCTAASISWVKMNWLAPSYISGLLLFSLLFIEKKEITKQRKWKIWPKAGFILAILFAIGAYLIPITSISPIPGDTWSGWPELGEKISIMQKEMEKEKPTFIFGNLYKVSAEMWFNHPQKMRTYSSNILGQDALEFDYFPPPNPEGLVGQNAIFVFADLETFDNFALLNKHFERVEKEPNLEIKHHEKIFRTFTIFKCFGYTGPQKVNK